MEAHARWTHLCWVPPMGRAQNPQPQTPTRAPLPFQCPGDTPGCTCPLMCLTELIHLCCTCVCEPLAPQRAAQSRVLSTRVWDLAFPYRCPLGPSTGLRARVHPVCAHTWHMKTLGLTRHKKEVDSRGSGAAAWGESLSLRGQDSDGEEGTFPQMHDDRARLCLCVALCSMGEGHSAASSLLVGLFLMGVPDLPKRRDPAQLCSPQPGHP